MGAKLNLLKANEKIVLIRPLVVFLVFFVIGLVTCFFFYAHIIAIYISMALVTFVLFIVGVFDKKVLAIAFVAIILSLEGLLFLFLHNKNNYLQSGYYSGSGYVVSVSQTKQVILDNVTLEGKKIQGKIIVSGMDVQTGDYVSFAGKLQTIPLDSNYNVHRVAKGIYYQINLDFYRYETSARPSTRDKIVGFIRDGFQKASDRDTANYLISIMFGESEYLDPEVKGNFTTTGVAHVFAVSGLHVGVLSSVILFILKKLKVKYNISLVISTAILFFYCYLCNFSPSVLRATIMFVMANILLTVFKQTDRLSIISFSAISTLLFKPIWIGDFSFLLSYGAVLGIYLFFPKFKNLYRFAKHGRKLLEALSLNLAVTISLIPLTCYFFGSFSPFAIITSFLIIPLTSCLYVLAVISLPFVWSALLLKPFLFIAKYVVLASGLIAAYTAKINSSISIAFSGLGLPFWYAALFTFSKYVNTHWRTKYFLGSCFVVLTFIV